MKPGRCRNFRLSDQCTTVLPTQLVTAGILCLLAFAAYCLSSAAASPTSTAELTRISELLVPHANELNAKLASTAAERQGRKLQQVWSLRADY